MPRITQPVWVACSAELLAPLAWKDTGWEKLEDKSRRSSEWAKTETTPSTPVTDTTVVGVGAIMLLASVSRRILGTIRTAGAVLYVLGRLC